MKITKRFNELIKQSVDKVPSDWLYFKVATALYSLGNPQRVGSKTRFKSVGKNLFTATDPDGKHIYFAERSRFRLYHYLNGVDRRICDILDKYTHEMVRVEKGDFVIDIGANVGEYSIAVSDYASDVLAFDPDPNIQNALKENLKRLSNVKLFEVALSDSEGDVNFFLSTKDADSSLVEPDEFSRTVTVKAVTLDQVISEQKIKKIDFLKLEAEGWEPEILAGASDTLKIVKKIAIDAGPERFGETTIDAVCQILQSFGFKVLLRDDIVFGCR